MDNETTDNVDNGSAQNSLLNGGDTGEPNSTETTTTTTDNSEMPGFEALVKSLPDDLQANPNLSKFQNFEDLAKSYIEQSKLVGRKTTIPGEDASADDWNEFWKNAGRPESPNEYGIDVPEQLQSDRVETALQAAHDAGLTKKQAEAFMGKMFEVELAAAEEQSTAQAEALKAHKTKLEETWGKNFSDEAAKVTALEKKLGVFEDFEAAGLNANADLLIALSKIANDLKGESTIDTIHNNDKDVSVNQEIQTLRTQMFQANKEGDAAKRDEIRIKLNKLYETLN